MSHQVNDRLMERASEMMGEYEGTMVEDAIAKAIADNDLERLEYLVIESEAETSRQEFNTYDIY